MSQDILQEYQDRLDHLEEDELLRLQGLLRQLNSVNKRELAQEKFIEFVRRIWPDFVEGSHHRVMADAFDRIGRGKLKRLIINLGPRHSKSELASYLLPAWYFGKFPKHKVMQASHTADLSTGFGRKVRDLVETKEYQSIFPGVGLKSDSKAASKWMTDHGGEYYAVGVNGNIAGRGANLFIIDDPHSEQDMLANEKDAFEKAYEWYTSGPRQRLQPNAAVVIVMTRWAKQDLTGRLLKKMAQDKTGDQWEVIELPAMKEDGEPIWPEFWSKEELLRIKSDIPTSKWQAQYLQKPTANESSIIKRTHWKKWEAPDPPRCEYILQSWDTAFNKDQRADYSACTTWGVFYQKVPNIENLKNQSKNASVHMDSEGHRTKANLILLDAFKEKLEFPELKRRAYVEWKKWKPDSLIVENKAAGLPLIYELRKRGVPVESWNVSKGAGGVRNDKIARVNAIADIFDSGVVWCTDHNFAEEVIEEFADFPAGEHDDLVDSSTQAIYRFRQGGFLPLETDWDYEEDEDNYREPVRAAYY